MDGEQANSQETEQPKGMITQLVHDNIEKVGDVFDTMTTEAERLWGFKPNEAGLKVMQSVVEGKPLAEMFGIERGRLDATLQVARADMRAGDYHAAYNKLQVLAMADYTNKSVWLALAMCLRKLNLTANAAECYCIAVVQDSTDFWPLIQALDCYIEVGDVESLVELEEIMDTLILPSIVEDPDTLKSLQEARAERVPKIEALYVKFLDEDESEPAAAL